MQPKINDLTQFFVVFALFAKKVVNRKRCSFAMIFGCQMEKSIVQSYGDNHVDSVAQRAILHTQTNIVPLSISRHITHKTPMAIKTRYQVQPKINDLAQFIVVFALFAKKKW